MGKYPLPDRRLRGKLPSCCLTVYSVTRDAGTIKWVHPEYKSWISRTCPQKTWRPAEVDELRGDLTPVKANIRHELKRDRCSHLYRTFLCTPSEGDNCQVCSEAAKEDFSKVKRFFLISTVFKLTG